MTEEALILMAAKMIQARKSLRDLLGEGYESMLEPCRVLIRASMKHRSCGAIKATTDLTNAILNSGADGMVAMKMIAACADVLEKEEA